MSDTNIEGDCCQQCERHEKRIEVLLGHLRTESKAREGREALLRENEALRALHAQDVSDLDRCRAELAAAIKQRDYAHERECACERGKTELVRQLNEQKSITNDWRETAARLSSPCPRANRW